MDNEAVEQMAAGRRLCNIARAWPLTLTTTHERPRNSHYVLSCEDAQGFIAVLQSRAPQIRVRQINEKTRRGKFIALIHGQTRHFDYDMVSTRLTAMRTKIAIGIVLLAIVSVVLVLRSSPVPPAASLTFTGYSEDGRYASFSFTNHTGRYLDHSHARIQIPTATGWTNYYDREEMLMCRLIGPLSGHQATTLSAALPPDQQRWRAAVHFSVMPDYDSRWRMRLQLLLAFLHLDTSSSESTLTTKEFVRWSCR